VKHTRPSDRSVDFVALEPGYALCVAQPSPVGRTRYRVGLQDHATPVGLVMLFVHRHTHNIFAIAGDRHLPREGQPAPLGTRAIWRRVHLVGGSSRMVGSARAKAGQVSSQVKPPCRRICTGWSRAPSCWATAMTPPRHRSCHVAYGTRTRYTHTRTRARTSRTVSWVRMRGESVRSDEVGDGCVMRGA
jgi:hypothetical protein